MEIYCASMQLDTDVYVARCPVHQAVIGEEVRAWFRLAIQFTVRNPRAIYTLCWKPN